MRNNFQLSRALLDIASIFIGVALFLIGLRITSYFFSGVWLTAIGVIPLLGAVFFISHRLNIAGLIGHGHEIHVAVIVALFALLGIVFARFFVFNGYFDNGSDSISFHPEHDWTYHSMLEIADAIQTGHFSLDYLYGLNLNQYSILYAYGSLIFVAGGDVVTHICLWNALHLAIIVFLTLKISYLNSWDSQSNLWVIAFIILMQPALFSTFVYDRDIPGLAIMLVGVYLFIVSYQKPLLCLFLLPFYGFCFYSFRLQYAILALVLFVWSNIRTHKSGISTTIGIICLVAVSVLLYNRVDFQTDINEGLNVINYTQDANKSIVNTIIQALVGYFPWTNLLRDLNWSYHVFLYFQAPMHLVMYYWIYKCIRNNELTLVNNPVFVIGVLLVLFASISAGHVKYFAVATPMLISCISSVGIKQFFNTYIKIVSIVIILSLLYDTMGLTGSGFIN